MPVTLLLIEDSSKAMRILSPGNIAKVVCPVSEDHFLHLQGICPEGLLVMTGKKVAITSPVNSFLFKTCLINLHLVKLLSFLTVRFPVFLPTLF